MQDALPYALVIAGVGLFFYIKTTINKFQLAQKVKEDTELNKKQETLSNEISDLKRKLNEKNNENPEDFWRKN